MTDLRGQIGAALGRDVMSLSSLRGGDVADAFQVQLADGATVFAKTHRRAPPGFFSTEAAGLAWLREAEAAPIPEVLAVSDDPPLLILEWVEPGRPARSTDPAAHAGHREFDLAMMRLFGGFGEDCFAAYAETFPLGADWEERVALHQLAPLVVHAIKFGGSYVSATQQALASLR